MIRYHGVKQLTTADLERTKRDLHAKLGPRAGIDAELGFQVLEPDAGGCSGHALTGEERGYERAVIGVGADGSGATGWTPPDAVSTTAGVR